MICPVLKPTAKSAYIDLVGMTCWLTDISATHYPSVNINSKGVAMNVSSVSPLRWDTSSWHILDSFSARCIQSSNKSSGHWLRSEPSHPNRWRHCPSMQWWLRWCYRSGSPSKEVHSLPATGVLLVKIQWKVQCFTFLGSPITRYLLFEFFFRNTKNESLTYHWLRWSGSHIIHHGALCSWAYWILFGFVTSLSEGRQMQDHATSYERTRHANSEFKVYRNCFWRHFGSRCYYCYSASPMPFHAIATNHGSITS